MDKLPEELLGKIFQGLGNNGLGVLTQVNKKCCRIATPLLYSNCQLACSDPRLQLCKVRRMLRTLVAQPERGQFIHEISIGDWVTSEDFGHLAYINEATISVFELSTIVHCLPLLDRQDLGYRRKWALDLLNSTQDGMAMTILSMLPNLQSLSLDKRVDKWYAQQATGQIH